MRFLSLLLIVLLSTTVSTINAQDSNTQEEKALKKAQSISMYMNAKITDEANKVSADQIDKIKQAYLDYYNDKKEWAKLRKDFKKQYKAFKEKAKNVTAENRDEIIAEQDELKKSQKYLNKERTEMAVRREKKIKDILNENQQPVF